MAGRDKKEDDEKTVRIAGEGKAPKRVSAKVAKTSRKKSEKKQSTSRFEVLTIYAESIKLTLGRARAPFEPMKAAVVGRSEVLIFAGRVLFNSSTRGEV